MLLPGELEKAKPEAEDGSSYMSGWDLPPSGSDSEQLEEGASEQDLSDSDNEDQLTQVGRSASEQQPRQAGPEGQHGEKSAMDSEQHPWEAGVKHRPFGDSAAAVKQGHTQSPTSRGDNSDREAGAAAAAVLSEPKKVVAAGSSHESMVKASSDPSTLRSSEIPDAAGSSAVSRPVHPEQTSAEHGQKKQHHSQQHQHVADVRPAKVSEGEELIDVFRVHLGM